MIFYLINNFYSYQGWVGLIAGPRGVKKNKLNKIFEKKFIYKIRKKN